MVMANIHQRTVQTHKGWIMPHQKGKFKSYATQTHLSLKHSAASVGLIGSCKKFVVSSSHHIFIPVVTSYSKNLTYSE